MCSIPAFAQRSEAPRSTELHLFRGTIEVSFDSSRLDLPSSAVFEWISNAAQAVSGYFEQFPVREARIRISIGEGRQGVYHGQSFGERGALCKIGLGQHTTADELRDDWMMAHEMVHFGFPSVEERHHWIEEGSATYIEPIARGRIGLVTPKRVWRDMMRDMPQGLPIPGDRGLNHTDTWASTYWGGALFCLLADVGIRKRTGNTKGLEHAFRAINRAGGSIETDWPLSRALDIGSKATDGQTLLELYDRMGTRRLDIDLAALWNQLGVVSREGEIEFDNNAPLAAIRAAILS